MIQVNGHPDALADFTLAMIESIPALNAFRPSNYYLSTESDSYAEAQHEPLPYIA
jgi:hypothetical protein